MLGFSTSDQSNNIGRGPDTTLYPQLIKGNDKTRTSYQSNNIGRGPHVCLLYSQIINQSAVQPYLFGEEFRYLTSNLQASPLLRLNL